MTDKLHQKKPRTIGSRLKSALFGVRTASRRTEEALPRIERFKLMYGRFREILALNDSVLELIADMEDKLSGRAPFAMEPIYQRLQRAMLDVVMMVKNLNQLAEGRYRKLYDTLGRINAEIEKEYSSPREVAPGPLVVPLEKVRTSDALLVGAKMANLGEVGSLGFNVPRGFVITTSAFAKVLSFNGLWESVLKLEGVIELYGAHSLEHACRQVQGSILSAALPPELEEALFNAYDELAGSDERLVAMRSSAVGEDSAASHAGQYYTELNVARDLLLDAYRTVIASPYKPTAVAYRYERGLTFSESVMAVGCVLMLEPRCSGIMFSRDFGDPGADRIVISVTPGLSVGIASGKRGAEELIIDMTHEAGLPRSNVLEESELRALIEASRRLEEHFGCPQDTEWLIDASGVLYVLQTRPMVAAPVEEGPPDEVPADARILLEGGRTASFGTGCGEVFQVRSENDFERFPDGAVLVARHSSPTFSRVMSKCSAIVTDVGSPTGHMAILAREFGVPAIVGLEGATSVLEPGMPVTVVASACRVYGASALQVRAGRRELRAPLADSPVVRHLRRMARLITPLNLTDPSSPEFSPEGCRSLHDIVRFVHEKVYEIMFRFGDMAARDRDHSFKLDVPLPIEIRLFDVGEGIDGSARDHVTLKPEHIRSIPMKAFLSGLLDPRIKWDQPRNVSAKGFLSVLGESMAAPPARSQKVGSVSYVVISDRYMNFSTKAGYHFSTVDVYCGESQNKNYIHFRFAGGGAGLERRARRVRFLSEVLTNLDFKVQSRQDFLVARLEKYDQAFIAERLVDLGRLTLCSRQLDMLMDTDSSPVFFARAFLRGEIERF